MPFEGNSDFGLPLWKCAGARIIRELTEQLDAFVDCHPALSCTFIYKTENKVSTLFAFTST
jgi:hypothetical protein